jgi:hypothetical protein
MRSPSRDADVDTWESRPPGRGAALPVRQAKMMVVAPCSGHALPMRGQPACMVAAG